MSTSDVPRLLAARAKGDEQAIREMASLSEQAQALEDLPVAGGFR